MKPLGRLAALAALALALAAPVMARDYIYAGTWNNVDAGDGLGIAKGVYGWAFDPDTGEATPLGLVAETVLSADSLAAAPDGHTLYVSEYNGCLCTRSWAFPGAPPAGIAAYRIDPATGGLHLLGRVDAMGDMPAEMRVDATGRTLALANYYTGNVLTYRIAESGALEGPVSTIQLAGTRDGVAVQPHAHGLAFSADNRWLYVADRGLDRLYRYRFDPAASRIDPEGSFIQFPPEEGARQVSVSPDGKWVFVLTELSGKVHRFAVASDGSLEERQSISLVPQGAAVTMGAAQSRMSPDGHFLYSNHRPNEQITLFPLDAATGTLGTPRFFDASARAARGDRTAPTPFFDKKLWDLVRTGARSFDWDASARWVASANLGENALVLFRRDPASGALADAGLLAVPQPSFVIFVRPQ